MITVTVCVGSSCHLKGARNVINRFNELVGRHGPEREAIVREAFYKRILEPMGIGPTDKPERAAQQ